LDKYLTDHIKIITIANYTRDCKLFQLQFLTKIIQSYFSWFINIYYFWLLKNPRTQINLQEFMLFQLTKWQAPKHWNTNIQTIYQCQKYEPKWITKYRKQVIVEGKARRLQEIIKPSVQTE